MLLTVVAMTCLGVSPIERPCAEVPEALIPPWPGKPSEHGPATPEQMARAQQVALEGPDAGALPPEVLLALGHALFAEGRAKEASSSYLGFLKAFPESPFAIDALEALLLLTAESGSREMSYRVLARFAPVMAQLSPERRARTEVFVAAVTGHWAKARCYTHGWHGFTALREYLKLFPAGARARAFVFYSMSPKDGDLDPESPHFAADVTALQNAIDAEVAAGGTPGWVPLAQADLKTLRYRWFTRALKWLERQQQTLQGK